MASEEVHPLRISKSIPSSLPAKMASSASRPLSEISPTEKRRNSPSWYQPTSPKKSTLNTDSSPFQSSPAESVSSPRLFWQNRNPDNMLYGGRSGSPSPTRRPSIERLQRASRVKNSNILALEQKQEYDPTRIPQIERPLSKVQGHAFGSSGSLGPHSSGSERQSFDFSHSDSKSSTSMMSPTKQPLSQPDGAGNVGRVSSKDQAFPAKSSLSPSKFKGSFDQENNDAWSAESSLDEHQMPGGRSLHRHAKSVTFDAAPPQINEYEMATPDLSSIGTNSREGSYESIEDEDDDGLMYDPAHIDLHDESFDASLEDTAKTPVVGPDDWRGDSPMAQHMGGPEAFEGSPMPDATPLASARSRPTAQRTDSVNSNGEHRPLPPLPGMGLARTQSNGSATPVSPGLSAAAERMLGTHRSLPSPPPATTSKSDIQNIGNGKMTLEERLKLMMMSDDNDAKTAAEQQRERRLRRANGRERVNSPSPGPEESVLEAEEADDTLGDISALDDYQLPSQISRESIMRRVNSNKAHDRQSDFNFSSPAPSSSPQRSPARSPERLVPLDPDFPIPSTEKDVDEIEDEEEEEGSVIITRSAVEEDDVFEIYEPSDIEFDDEELATPLVAGELDAGSHYSDNQSHRGVSEDAAEIKAYEDDAMTPRASTPVEQPRMSLKDTAIPDLAPPKQTEPSPKIEEVEPSYEQHENIDDENQNGTARTSLMAEAHAYLQRPFTPEQTMSKPEYDGSGWGEPEEEDVEDDEPGTPESIIRDPVAAEQKPEVHESPAIPERYATIKASGSKLKTRVSNTPSDLAAMREARRQVSHEVPQVPPIPEKHRNRISRDLSVNQEAGNGNEFLDRHPSFKNRSLTLDLDLGLSLDQDFDRVMETQKRGYLMRQNTKLVAASDKETAESFKVRSAGNSPVKQDRPQSWTVEPWNSKARQGTVRRRHDESGPVPPLPGQESNARALGHVVEEEAQLEMNTPESGERGRLFVKVMGVKDLDLPLAKNERTWFSLTLDNGVHCVTTAWLELARNAPIGQEFELVVPNDLEFQLTLNVKLEKPAPTRVPPSAAKAKSKGSAFSRVFASPKKRKEMDLRHREEEERQAQQHRDALAHQRNNSPTSYDLLSPLTAEDGSFGRSYVCLKEHENRCFGRPYMAEVACFNEWATEEAGFASSVKSKRGNTAVVRRAPYKVGKLELQLLFVPRPKNSTDEDMPKSMNSCIRELKATEERLARNWEGHLSQQGGDCPYWRRRYFKLVGAKLTAYHEATRQPRATINLSNAKRLIDDRKSLTEKETTVKGGRRRRSAFAEEEEGYMFVEEGFRIRFNNGEVIDFYADTAEDKDGWMGVLSDVIGRGDNGADDEHNGVRTRAKWCELVLKREEQQRRRAEGRRTHSKTKSMIV